MLASTMIVIFALAVATGLHYALWWVRAQGLGLIAGFGFLCFVPTALFALDYASNQPVYASGQPPSPLGSALWVRLALATYFIAPPVLGLYHSRWLKPTWTPWLWTKATFAVYAEIVLVPFVYTITLPYIGAAYSQSYGSGLYMAVYGLAVLLLACFGPCLSRFVRLAIPLVREAW